MMREADAQPNLLAMTESQWELQFHPNREIKEKRATSAQGDWPIRKRICSKSNPSPGTMISTPVFGSELFVARIDFFARKGVKGNWKLFTCCEQSNRCGNGVTDGAGANLICSRICRVEDVPRPIAVGDRYAYSPDDRIVTVAQIETVLQHQRRR